eukprot:gene11441-biopygen7854
MGSSPKDLKNFRVLGGSYLRQGGGQVAWKCLQGSVNPHRRPVTILAPLSFICSTVVRASTCSPVPRTSSEGRRIEKVIHGSPAEEAGLREPSAHRGGGRSDTPLPKGVVVWGHSLCV